MPRVAQAAAASVVLLLAAGFSVGLGGCASGGEQRTVNTNYAGVPSFDYNSLSAEEKAEYDKKKSAWEQFFGWWNSEGKYDRNRDGMLSVDERKARQDDYIEEQKQKINRMRRGL